MCRWRYVLLSAILHWSPFTWLQLPRREQHVANDRKQTLVQELSSRFGHLRCLPGSQSLFELSGGQTRIYLRYSRVHRKECAFFGLRQIDLNQLDGHNSFVCLFTDDSAGPLFIPHQDFEQVIRQSALAADGQYKVQLVSGRGTRELYIPRVGRFNVDAYGGIETIVERVQPGNVPEFAVLTHPQVQTLLGSIGHLKGFSVYVPLNNIDALDWALVPRFNLIERLPNELIHRCPFAGEVDVMWLDYSRGAVSAAFEVEHSTPVYSGLLRFNDMLLTSIGSPRFFIVANESRRDLFARQLQRPTFQRSGLSEIASFLDYSNVFGWHRRLHT